MKIKTNLNETKNPKIIICVCFRFHFIYVYLILKSWRGFKFSYIRYNCIILKTLYDIHILNI